MKKAKALFYILILIIAAFLIQRLISRQNKEPDYSKEYDNQGVKHIETGEEHPPYNSNPPSSGWHYAQPAREDFYAEELADEQLVHNLEHGDVWIAYNPRISQEIKDGLKKFSGRKVIITPRQKNDFDISLVAWRRVDGFNIEGNALDEKRINNFIKRYLNKGPEKIP